jgi:hypothetical protein
MNAHRVIINYSLMDGLALRDALSGREPLVPGICVKTPTARPAQIVYT